MSREISIQLGLFFVSDLLEQLRSISMTHTHTHIETLRHTTRHVVIHCTKDEFSVQCVVMVDETAAAMAAVLDVMGTADILS